MTNDFEVSFTDKVWDCHVLEPQAVVDGWVVDSFIGVGGFGAVYGVHREGNENLRGALKILAGDPLKDEGYGIKSFRSEISLVERLSCECAPKFLGKGEVDRHPYFVMELLEPYRIDELPEKSEEVREFVLGLIAAVRILHRTGERGWVHRDIKPENIARRPSDGRIVLIDFGTAHVMDDANAECHVPRARTMRIGGRYCKSGTQGYAPPELLYRPCCDIFAIGRVIRDCFKEDVPVQWSLILNKCISTNPTYRYATVDGLERDVIEIDRVGREEMHRIAFDERLTSVELQAAMVATPAEVYSWIRLKDELSRRQSGEGEVFAGCGQVFVDFAALKAKHVRVLEQVTLKEDRMLVVKGPGVLEMNLDALLSDEYAEDFSDDAGFDAAVILLDNATLINKTTKPIDRQHIRYLVGDSCYLNFEHPEVGADADPSNGEVLTSNLGYSYVSCGGPRVLRELLQVKDKAIESALPLIYRYSSREVGLDQTGELCMNGKSVKYFLLDNDVYRRSFGMLSKCSPKDYA